MIVEINYDDLSKTMTLFMNNGKRFKIHHFFQGYFHSSNLYLNESRKLLRYKMMRFDAFKIGKNNYENNVEKKKLKQKHFLEKVFSITYDVLNKHDTNPRSSMTKT